MKLGGLGTFLSPCNYPMLLPFSSNIPFSLPPTSKSDKIGPFGSTYSSSSSFAQKTLLGISISASSRRKSNHGTENDYGEEKMMLMMPFDEMRRWFQNKPSGFGQGKTYDTSVEETLLEEIQQSRRAQHANITKLTNCSRPSKKLDQQLQKKAPEVLPSGIQVRVGNLPKKKNIHRDLHLAFKGFPGIVNIFPAVSGNKKTRDPICKGFAIIYLESEETACRFVEVYSKKSIQFGKIQKQITCETMIPLRSFKQTAVSICPSTQLGLPDMGEDIEADPENCFSWDSLEGAISEGGDQISVGGSIEDLAKVVYSGDSDAILSHCQEIEVGDQNFNASEQNNKENERQQTKERGISKQGSRNRVFRKQLVKEKSGKLLTLEFPQTAKRLKIKDRALLTGVFTKYGKKADMD